MLIRICISRSNLRQIIYCVALPFCWTAYAQPTALLEACNAVEDKEKRLACFKELSTYINPTPSATAANAKRVKNAFAAVAGAVSSGISLSNYSALLLEPSKELEIFKQERPTPSQQALDLYDDALLAYRDAEKVWHASIYKSSDAGIFFGKVLNPNTTGLQGIVKKYNLPTREVLMNPDLPAEAAIGIIWRYARARTQAANDATENLEIDTTNQNPQSNFKSLNKSLDDPLKFQWPANGIVLTQFGESSQGLVIDGNLGDPVVATRSGIVVFSSSGLNGYGKLIIIKHDDTYLSAYAHNSELLVEEGVNVKKGQIIAKMGATDSDKVKLSFEIRKHGKAVDPMQYLAPDKH